MGASFTEAKATTSNEQPDEYFIDENYMNRGMSSPGNGKLLYINYRSLFLQR